jgi:cyanophycin synthetase
MLFAQVITEAHGRMELPVACGASERQDGQRGWIALGYHDAPATAQAMRFALAAALSASQPVDATAKMKPQATATIDKQLACQPRIQSRGLMRAARRRGIPVYSVAEGSSIWQFGQGRKGWHGYSSSTQFDSNTGVMLQQNKVQSNELVRRLGFPGVEHGLADRPLRALALAENLGYPLVVKPLDSGMGLGVTVNVNNPDEVTTAFRTALRWSSRKRVIVERFVPGDDHRIMVTGGKFQWAIKRTPPEVTGDGISSIDTLIAQKNARIADDDIEKGFAKRVTVDDELRRMLASQQMGPEDHPPSGKVVRLRANANVATGGAFTDITPDTHPDNRAMAETIARAFRLDAVGIDFITRDISHSWREGHCAVIEVNFTPGQLCDAHLEQLLANKFVEGDNGRIPSVLLLCDTPANRSRLFAKLTGIGHGVGTLTRTEVRLNGSARLFGTTADAGTVAQALLLDPDCEALVAICTLNEIRQRGLPLDRFDACVWTAGAEPDQALHELLHAFCKTLTKTSAETVADTLQKILMRADQKQVISGG